MGASLNVAGGEGTEKNPKTRLNFIITKKIVIWNINFLSLECFKSLKNVEIYLRDPKA